MNERLAARIAADCVDDDAWAAFTAARFDLDVNLLRAVFTGDATTRRLPVAVAAELVARLSSAAAAAAVTVDEALGANRERRLAELTAAITRAVADGDPRRARHVAAQHLADAAAAIISGTSPIPGVAADGLLPRLEVTSQVVETLTRHGRGNEVLEMLVGRIGQLDGDGSAALLASVGRRGDRSAHVPVTDELLTGLTGAVKRLASLDGAEVKIFGVRTAANNVVNDLAGWFLTAGGSMFGDVSLAAALDVDSDELDPGVAARLVTYAAHARRADAVDEIVHTVTGHGLIAAPVKDLSPTMCSPAVSSTALALAVTSPAGYAGGEDLARNLLAAFSAHIVEPEEFLAADHPVGAARPPPRRAGRWVPGGAALLGGSVDAAQPPRGVAGALQGGARTPRSGRRRDRPRPLGGRRAPPPRVLRHLRRTRRAQRGARTDR